MVTFKSWNKMKKKKKKNRNQPTYKRRSEKYKTKIAAEEEAAGRGPAFEAFLQEGTIPDVYLCPITMCLLRYPVLAQDGFVYEDGAIRKWIQKCKSDKQPVTSPKTNLPMGETLVFNRTHRTSVLEFLETKKEEWKKICEAREKEEVENGKEAEAAEAKAEGGGGKKM